MKTRYCLPIIKNTKNEILEIIHANKNDYDFFEVWIDYIENMDDAFLMQLVKKLGYRFILILRRQNFEKEHLRLENRFHVISLLANTQSFIDLDMREQEKEIQHIKTNHLKVNVILSYHNYEETPSDSTLRIIIDRMDTYNPTIIKVSTLCRSKRDALRLLQLLLELEERRKKCIVLGMGEFGSITRIFGTLWGNEMIFAPKTVSEQSAPGQLTKSQLEVILKQLEG